VARCAARGGAAGGAGPLTGRLTWLRVPDEAELPAEVLELWQPSLEKLGFVPNVLRLYALRPSRLLACVVRYHIHKVLQKRSYEGQL